MRVQDLTLTSLAHLGIKGVLEDLAQGLGVGL